jgi:hypothetical protein
VSAGAAFAALGMLVLVASGAHMVLRPHTYLGKGSLPATDPRTVRWFGLLTLVLGAVSVALSLIKFVSE